MILGCQSTSLPNTIPILCFELYLLRRENARGEHLLIIFFKVFGYGLLGWVLLQPTKVFGLSAAEALSRSLRFTLSRDCECQRACSSEPEPHFAFTRRVLSRRS